MSNLSRKMDTMGVMKLKKGTLGVEENPSVREDGKAGRYP